MDKFIRYLKRDNFDSEMFFKKSLILLAIIYASCILMQIIGEFLR